MITMYKFNKRRIQSKVLSQFFTDMHHLFATGMSVRQIIMSLKETTFDLELKMILPQVDVFMNEGESLSDAFKKTQKFPSVVYTTIFAGEQSGRLKENIYTLAEYFKREGQITCKLTDALFYPCIVFLFLFLVMFFISFKVVPKLQELLPSQSLKEPATIFVLSLTRLVQVFGPFILLLAIIGGMSALYFIQHHKERFEHMVYQIPVIGDLYKESILAVYFLNLSVLLQSGMPLIKSISQMNFTSSQSLTTHFMVCRDYMLGGLSFWESLQQEHFFPSVVVMTIRRGEEAGRIGEYCTHLCDYLNQRVYSAIDRAINLIQPLCLLIGGLFLVLLALAFLVPIYGSLSRISGG